MTLLPLLLFLANIGASQQLLQQACLGSSFWAVGCISGASLRAIGQRVRGH